jgi:hypothetical protein
MVFPAPGNLFLRLTVEEQTSSDATTGGTAAAVSIVDVKKTVTLTPVLATGSVVNTSQNISACDLYINNIFVNPEIHDLYIKRIGFSLIRLHRSQIIEQTTSNADMLLSNLKYPVEYMWVGLRPKVNIASTNTNQYRDWHRMTLMTDHVIEEFSRSEHTVMIDDSVAYNEAVTTKRKGASSTYVSNRIVYPQAVETIDQIKLMAHGIELFAQYGSAFYRDYLTYSFGAQNVVTPEDKGVLMINFCLYPGTYQPSGHINVSRAREFHLHVWSSYAGPNTQADLIVDVSCLNFLLISDGSAVVRYAT